MKRIALLCIVLMVTAMSCSKNDLPPGVPNCMRELISEFKASDMLCEDAHVYLNEFQGRNVYVFSVGSCGADQMASVVDENCNLLGAVGGLTGNTKINGEDFSTSKWIREIWRRRRN